MVLEPYDIVEMNNYSLYDLRNEIANKYYSKYF